VGTGLAARTVWRWLRAPGIVRLVNALLILGGAAIALLAAAAAVHALQLPTSEIDTTLRTWWLAQCGLVALMATSVAASGLRARRLAGKVTEVVLAAVPDADSLRQTLAAIIDAPDLALVFPRDDGHAADAAGQQVREADSSLAVVRVTRADVVVAEVRCRASLTGASHQLAASVRAAGLGVEHLAAHARLRAELAVSRLRIVEAGDTERRRLERDLHDGAQQRLIALQVLLQMAATAAPPTLSASYADARGEVGAAHRAGAWLAPASGRGRGGGVPAG
jgi:signal transduction histidine kinase